MNKYTFIAAEYIIRLQPQAVEEVRVSKYLTVDRHKYIFPAIYAVLGVMATETSQKDRQ